MIRAATSADIGPLAADITEAGMYELAEVYGYEPVQALERNLSLSSQSWTIEAGGEVLAMLGVAPVTILGDIGELWCVGAKAICRHRIAFARASQAFLRLAFARWSEIRCLIEYGNEDVSDWVRWLGGEVSPVNDRMGLLVLRRS